eukprot:3314610-Pyramimonas_sp.AAC.1
MRDLKRKYHIEDSGDGDARALPINTVGDQRKREFGDAVSKKEAVQFSDWETQTPGPRTTFWHVVFLRCRNGPLAHHGR